ncbi:MAG: SAM-dependent chlorinase/fluorinase, partial [Chloroflexota bacterium]|nr:SAM-dependent chlorinase/fluorinase [Chloroflexota bacterium]
MARHFTRSITTPAAARMAREWNRPLISLLSDFGSRDPSAGIMRGVALGIAPDALIVDISHEVDKFAVADGALLLWSALPYMPIGSHVAVVDPGVGTERRGVALETARGDYLIGPDNGLLIPGATRLGGIVRAHLLDNPAYRLPVVSSSFHGRDLFAPAAAHLALGVPLEVLGPWLDPMELVALDWPEPWIGDGELATSVVYVDTFGNVKLGALAAELEESLVSMDSDVRLEVFAGHPDLPATRSRAIRWANTFGGVPVGEPLILADSYGRLSLAVNQGSAAEALRLETGAEVWIRAAGKRRSEVAAADAPTISFAPPGREPDPAPAPPAPVSAPPAPEPEP